MFRTRVLSGVVIAFLSLGLLILCHIIPLLLPLLVSLLVVQGLLEFYLPFKNKGVFPSKYLGIFFALLLVWQTYFGLEEYLSLNLILMFTLIPIFQFIKSGKLPDFIALGVTCLGVLYLGLLPSFFLKIRNLLGSINYLIFLIFVTWSGDTFAYFTGKLRGRRKLIALISPNKTIEGSLGGILFTIITALLLGEMGRYFGYLEITWVKASDYLILGLLIAVVGQIGDLYQSAWKRYLGMKDSGNLIPEHGGILDRIDSILFAAPLFYYYFLWLSP